MWIPTIKLISCRILRNPFNFGRFFSISAAIQTTPSFEELPISIHHPTTSSDHYLELNTSGVVGILNKLRKKPDDALLFFRQVDNHGLCDDIDCYSAIVRILCGSGLEKKLGSLFLELIRSKEKHPKFEVSALFNALAESFGICDNDEKLSPLNRVLDVLIKSYAELGMFDDAVDALFKTGRRGIMPCVRSCNFIINCLVECGRTDMALALFRQLRDRMELCPDVYTYTIVIKAYCRRGNLGEAIDLFKDMDEAGITDAYARMTMVEGLCLNKNTTSGYAVLQAWRGSELLVDAFGYNAVIHGFCNEMKLQEAENVLNDMRKHGVARNEYSYSKLIRAYCRNGNILRAFSLHKEMVSDGVKSNCFIASAILQCLCKMGLTAEVVDYFQWFKDSGMFLDEVSYNIVIDACCNLGEMQVAVELLDDMKERRMVPDAIHYTCLINGYCRRRELKSALGILQEMKEMGVKPDIVTYNILVGELYKQGYAQEAVDLLRYMEAEGFKPNDNTYCAIIKGLCRGGLVKEAREILDALEEKCVLTCSAMVNGYCETDHTGEAYGLFVNLLSRCGLLVNKRACSNLLEKLYKEGDTDRALVAFNKMLNFGLDLDEIEYSKLIAALCRTGNMKKARHVFDILVSSGVTPDVKTYTTMLNGYCKVYCLQEAYNLFDDMKERGVKPDVITYTVLINGDQKENWKHRSNRERLVNQNSPGTGGTKGKAYDASALQSEADIMGIEHDVVYYTVLIDGHCKANNLQDAVQIFEEMMDRGLIPDAITYTALVSGYCSQGDVDRAVYLVDEMTSKGITPDTHTISALMNGYEILEARKVKFTKGKASKR